MEPDALVTQGELSPDHHLHPHLDVLHNNDQPSPQPPPPNPGTIEFILGSLTRSFAAEHTPPERTTTRSQQQHVETTGITEDEITPVALLPVPHFHQHSSTTTTTTTPFTRIQLPPLKRQRVDNGPADEVVTPTPTSAPAPAPVPANVPAKGSTSLLDDLISIMTAQAPTPTRRFDLQTAQNTHSSSMPTSGTVTTSTIVRARDDDAPTATSAAAADAPQESIDDDDTLPLLRLLDAQMQQERHPVLQQRSGLHRRRRPLPRARRRPRCSLQQRAERNDNCPICLERVDDAVQFRCSVRCQHRVCQPCAVRMLVSFTNDSTKDLPVPCPFVECDSQLRPRSCLALLKKKAVPGTNHADIAKARDDFELLITRSKFVYHLAYCANDECKHPFDWEVETTSDCKEYSRVKCPVCTHETCVRCKVPWHEGKSCIQEKAKAMEKDGIHSLIMKRKWTPCPQCGYAVDRISGCSHMSCTCGCRFCYTCGMELKYHKRGSNSCVDWRTGLVPSK